MTTPTIFDRIAELYEAVASMPATMDGSGGRATGKPGSRVPPGLSVVLDEDEYTRAVEACDTFAEFVVRVLIDEVPGVGSVPEETPGRLRLAGTWARELRGLEPRLWYSVWGDAQERLSDMKRLARRGTREVRTGSPCLDITCHGQFVATLDGPDEADGDIVCDQCRATVPASSWQRWGSRQEWVTVERAMSILGVDSKHAVWSRAKRERWRRRGGPGNEVRYNVHDIMERQTKGKTA